MLHKREKAELIVKIHEAENDQNVISIMKLIDILVQEHRIDNDTATYEGVMRNQGSITALDGLKEWITRGLPDQGPKRP